MNESNYKTTENNQQASTPPKKSSKKGCLIIFLVTVIVILCSFFFFIFLIVALLFSSDISANLNTDTQLKQMYISGSKNAQNKIALITINGIILDNNSSWGKTANMNAICDQLKEAARDKKIKAVLLYINSPGGEITATDIIHHNIEKVRNKKPVIALLGSLAASGGYYAAVASNYIIANHYTTTGSIGVIINSYNYYDLLQKIGIHDEVYKSKELKDLLNPARPRTKVEKVIIQSLINESYDGFVKVVSKGRIDKNKKLTVEYIKNSNIGDGRIFSGTQALKLGLIDQLGYFDDAVNKTAELAHLKKNDFQLIAYQRQLSLSDIFQKFVTKANTVTVEIPAIKQFNILDSGKLYYLYKEN
jgi:protease IV